MSVWSILIIATCVVNTYGYNILVVFPVASRSHSILGDGVVSALAKAGHQITYITPFPKGKGPNNVREIDLSLNQKFFPDDFGDVKNYLDKPKNAMNFSLFIDTLLQTSANTIQNADVQKLIFDPKEKFDVVVIEWFFNEYIAGLSAVFDCPYIWLSSSEPHRMVLQLVDEIPNPAYTSDALSLNIPPFTFYQRAQELVGLLGGLLWRYFVIDANHRKEYEKLFLPIFEKQGRPAPILDDIVYNASLILSNSHASIGKSIHLPQNFIPVGGYHISRDVKPLPENLQKMLDGAKNGLIYFSLGSNVKSKFMPEELKQSLLKMFGGLKYTVLWKFEEDLPGTPSNVHIVNWAPQQSILAHPNCVLFITHGGQLSTTEAVHFAKPIVAIPVFADQFINSERAVQLGVAKKVDLSRTMAGDVEKAIAEILGDPKYSARAKELSMIYHDRPVTPDKELVHWVEHVVKTRGALHLRSPALMVPWYQKMYLDLAAIIFIVLYLIVGGIKRIISYLRSGKNKTDKKQRGREQYQDNSKKKKH